MRDLQLGRADDPPARPGRDHPDLPDPVAPRHRALRHYGLDPQDPASWLFLDEGQAHKDFEAVLHAGRRYGGLGLLTQALRLIPRPLRDWLYRHLARNRYRLFGRADLCALPDPALQRRILR